MSAPRLEVDLDRIHHNARTLVDRLAGRGISVTGVTKATLGSPEVTRELLRAGVRSIGESRVENVESLRHAGITCHTTLIRSPMLSQVDRVIEHVDVSCNTELEVIAALSAAAVQRGRSHQVVLMVELGDLREGILAADLLALARRADRLPRIAVVGIGTNLACQNGVAPDEHNMAELSELAASLEIELEHGLDIVSGGNSANLGWALGPGDTGRVNDLRLGESILLGLEPLHRTPVDGLFTDAIAIVAEVIESNSKPSRPWGERGQTAFGQTAFGQTDPAGTGGATVHRRRPSSGDRTTTRAILAIGHQDVDPAGLSAPEGTRMLGASSDHLVLDTGSTRLPVGAEVRFGLDYSALVRAMSSPFVTRRYLGGVTLPGTPAVAPHR